MQYVDFSEWQNELLAAEDTEKEESIGESRIFLLVLI
jgi:hypothetical protein